METTRIKTVFDIRDESKFPLGEVVITESAMEVVSPSEAGRALSRHCRGDWGTVEMDDWVANDFALKSERRILSVYESCSEEVFWIITESDRSVTTILLPSEY